ncbi:MAG: helix-hairpin-helix domain-containing protein [Pirellulaceae bacterium]
MNPQKVKREAVRTLCDLPNVGPATEQDLHLLRIRKPADLKGRDAWQLYQELCRITKVKHDPCVIDVFLSIISFVDGKPARPWWKFTAQRKKFMAEMEK